MRTTGEIVKELNKITERLQTLEPSSKSWGIYSQRGMALDWVLGDSKKESLLLTVKGEHLLNDPLMYLRNRKTVKTNWGVKDVKEIESKKNREDA